MRILLVEDEIELGAIIKQGLEAVRYAVDWETDGEEGLRRAQAFEYDLIILDLMLPGRDGWSICKSLRSRRDRTPILMLTARGDLDDRVRGLELGADDYLAKPFAFKELRARVAALLRRDVVRKSSVIEIDDLVIDTRSRRVERGGIEVNLTPREYSLLEALAQREGEILSRDWVYEHVWSDAESCSNTIEVHLSSLRRKVDSNRAVRLIRTVPGFGYSLQAPEEKAA
jgi:two-component system, OmpR family, copper resistance phosphate regulon response regulator CusR